MSGSIVSMSVPLCLCATVLLLWTAEACMETAWSSGRMDGGQLLQGTSLTAPRANSCVCCALCHYQPGCVSLSFNAQTAECELYGSVASYATLQPAAADEWTYYVMPGHSETGQFCRQDSDCVTDGDFCRGRFCTALDKVTCRTVADTFGSIRHYEVEPVIYGWINGKQIMLSCWMEPDGKGYTTILWSSNGFQFDSSTLLEYNLKFERNKQGQSLLSLAEDLRQSESDPTYRLCIWTETNAGWDLVLQYDAPRNEPVLSDAARTDAWLYHVGSDSLWWSPSMLWMPAAGPTLLTTNADDGQTAVGAMARNDGAIEYVTIWVQMLE